MLGSHGGTTVLWDVTPFSLIAGRPTIVSEGHVVAADPCDKLLTSSMIAQCHNLEDRIKHVISCLNHGVRSALFWDSTQRRMAIPYRRIWKPVGPSLNLEGGTSRLYRNVVTKLPFYAA